MSSSVSGGNQNGHEDFHPPVTPPRTMERLFGLGDSLDTQSISGAALAQQIRSSSRGASSFAYTGGTSIATDDFCTAVEPPNKKPNTNIFNSTLEKIFSPHPPSDILTTTLISNTFNDDLSTDSGYPSDLDDNETERNQTKQLRKEVIFTSNKKDTRKEINQSIPELTETSEFNMSVKSAPSSTVVPESEPMHVDAAEKIYDTAKDVWAWGKGVIVFSPFLGIAEGVAGKFVNIATGQSLETVDRAVTDQIQGLDDKVFNPAIAFIVQTVLQAAGKTEEVVKPIIIKILTPFGLMKTTAENPEVTTVSGVTVTQG